jgi:hypothetical protein
MTVVCRFSAGVPPAPVILIGSGICRCQQYPRQNAPGRLPQGSQAKHVDSVIEGSYISLTIDRRCRWQLWFVRKLMPESIFGF